MNRLALLAVGVAGLTVLAAGPAAATPEVAAEQTVTTCGNSGLQAGLLTRLCAEVTGNAVQFYGKVSLAGPPSPGSPTPAPKELSTMLSAEVVGAGGPPLAQDKPVVFTTATLEVRGPATTVPCGTTVRGTFGVASFPWTPRPVVHEVTLTC
ncbi:MULTISPECIES: hypothetical protein [unclassified Streptomyces]|uniref:hypothetical protein n=1 Tax=unclassified Streptomyces TaxID=2593676 RepID=UPI00109E5E9B|nr:hypothetical protein [Streptomyces sp. A1136]THA58026.1 hypothetical protein E6R62_06025 [Streptomyces sp. A1136]